METNSRTNRNRRKGNTNCSVPGCNSVYRRDYNVSFHLFPKCGHKLGVSEVCDRRKTWITKLRMEKNISPSIKVCSRHFTPEDYESSGWSSRKKLKTTAIPTQNLPLEGQDKKRPSASKAQEERFEKSSLKKQAENGQITKALLMLQEQPTCTTYNNATMSDTRKTYGDQVVQVTSSKKLIFESRQVAVIEKIFLNENFNAHLSKNCEHQLFDEEVAPRNDTELDIKREELNVDLEKWIHSKIYGSAIKTEAIDGEESAGGGVKNECLSDIKIEPEECIEIKVEPLMGFLSEEDAT